jgi:hypothetical protein
VCALGGAVTANAATINAANCNSGSVQSAINAAVRGDTVIIPAGACTWTSGVTLVGKGIIIKGASTAGVVITNNVTSISAIRVTEDTIFHTEIAQLSIIGNSSQAAITIYAHDTPNNTGGKAVLLHDLNFSDSYAIRMETNRGVIYSIAANNHKGTQEVVQCKPEALGNSWTTPSTMGMADITGESNVYVESSTFTLACTRRSTGTGTAESSSGATPLTIRASPATVPTPAHWARATSRSTTTRSSSQTTTIATGRKLRLSHTSSFSEVPRALLPTTPA